MSRVPGCRSRSLTLKRCITRNRSRAGRGLLVLAAESASRLISRIPCSYSKRRKGGAPPEHRGDRSVEGDVTQQRKKLPPAEEVVAAVVALADDGFCPRGELRQCFPGPRGAGPRRAGGRGGARGRGGGR